MLNKTQLKNLETILESAISSLEKEADLNFLLIKDSSKNLENKRSKIKTAKITRAAKNLLLQFEDYGLTSYLDFADEIKLNVKNINSKSNLAPIKENVLIKVNKEFDKFELERDDFYNNMLLHIFNQGRQHQTIVNPTTKITHKKFASYEAEENKNFETLVTVLKDELMIYLSYLKDFINEDIENSYNISLNKAAMIKSLSKKMDKSSTEVQEILRKHAWQAYSFGNLYQLDRDKTEFVVWKTGSHIDDCLTCMDFQTGAAILKDGEGNNLPYIIDTDAVIYRLKDIFKVSKIDGPVFFSYHDGCRCQFISYDKKKALNWS
jgi:hypothetical protein